MPTSSTVTTVSTASSSVAGRRDAITSKTGVLKVIESPGFPLSNPPTNRKYCCHKGRS